MNVAIWHGSTTEKKEYLMHTFAFILTTRVKGYKVVQYNFHTKDWNNELLLKCKQVLKSNIQIGCIKDIHETATTES